MGLGAHLELCGIIVMSKVGSVEEGGGDIDPAGADDRSADDFL